MTYIPLTDAEQRLVEHYEQFRPPEMPNTYGHGWVDALAYKRALHEERLRRSRLYRLGWWLWNLR